jgi:hypothetical protein
MLPGTVLVYRDILRGFCSYAILPLTTKTFYLTILSQSAGHHTLPDGCAPFGVDPLRHPKRLRDKVVSLSSSSLSVLYRVVALCHRCDGPNWVRRCLSGLIRQVCALSLNRFPASHFDEVLHHVASLVAKFCESATGIGSAWQLHGGAASARAAASP